MYGTIVVTSVLVVYDGWANLKLADAIVVIVGPLAAIGHVFAAGMAAYPALGLRPRRGELLRIVRRESWFLLVYVPQIVLLLVLTLVGLAVLIGLALGRVVLLLQVFLQPGEAVFNGVAAIQPAAHPVASV